MAALDRKALAAYDKKKMRWNSFHQSCDCDEYGPLLAIYVGWGKDMENQSMSRKGPFPSQRGEI